MATNHHAEIAYLGTIGTRQADMAQLVHTLHATPHT